MVPPEVLNEKTCPEKNKKHSESIDIQYRTNGCDAALTCDKHKKIMKKSVSVFCFDSVNPTQTIWNATI